MRRRYKKELQLLNNPLRKGFYGRSLYKPVLSNVSATHSSAVQKLRRLHGNSAYGGLNSYIKYFWGTDGPLADTGIIQEGLIVTDTCMDIIFQVSHTNINISGIRIHYRSKELNGINNKF